MIQAPSSKNTFGVNPSDGNGSCGNYSDLYRSLSEEILSFRQVAEKLLAAGNTLRAKEYADRIMVKSNKRLMIIGYREICWIEAWGDYIRLHCVSRTCIVREKIHEIENRLDPKVFARISRSSLVNVDSIKELEPTNHGDYLVTLHDGTKLNLSRNYRGCFSHALGGQLSI